MYNIRDLLGHYVKLPPQKNQDGMCPHACCKGKRPHPDRFPVMLPKGMARRMTDRELADHFDKPTVGKSAKATRQVVDELGRRERKRELDLRTPAEKRKDVRARHADEYRAWLENEWVRAEAQTRGVMLNKRGKAKHVDPRALWTSKQLRDRYASDELRAYFDRHPVVSAREFGSRDAAAAGARRRRRTQLYGVY